MVNAFKNGPLSPVMLPSPLTSFSAQRPARCTTMRASSSERVRMALTLRSSSSTKSVKPVTTSSGHTDTWGGVTDRSALQFTVLGGPSFGRVRDAVAS